MWYLSARCVCVCFALLLVQANEQALRYQILIILLLTVEITISRYPSRMFLMFSSTFCFWSSCSNLSSFAGHWELTFFMFQLSIWGNFWNCWIPFILTSHRRPQCLPSVFYGHDASSWRYEIQPANFVALKVNVIGSILKYQVRSHLICLSVGNYFLVMFSNLWRGYKENFSLCIYVSTVCLSMYSQ